MGFIKTFAVAAGVAAVLGGAGIGVAQASSSTPTKATSSTSSTSHEAEARGRVAEGETHARHTGTDDPATHDVGDDNGRTRTSPSATPSAGHDAGDDHGSGGHGADG
jgi:hypothetical protein